MFGPILRAFSFKEMKQILGKMSEAIQTANRGKTLSRSQSGHRVRPKNKGDAMRSHKRSLIVALGLILLAALPATAGPLASRPGAPPLLIPAWSLTGSCYPIDFNGVDIEWYAGRGVYQLTVTGIKPYTNMEVSLSHEAYSGPPAYWRTLVIGCVKNGLMMPIASPYYVTMLLDQFVGSKGIEIVGASRSVRRAVPRS